MMQAYVCFKQQIMYCICGSAMTCAIWVNTFETDCVHVWTKKVGITYFHPLQTQSLHFIIWH